MGGAIISELGGGIIPLRGAASFRYEGRHHSVTRGGFLRNQQLYLERRQHCRIQIIEGQNGELIDRETFEREHLKKPPRYLRRPRLGTQDEGHAPRIVPE